MTQSNPDLLVRTGSWTLKEYEQALKQAVPGGVRGGPSSFDVEDGAVRIRIENEVLPDRVIALLSLPQLKSSWHFLSGTQEQQQACLKKIDWSMKRGGG